MKTRVYLFITAILLSVSAKAAEDTIARPTQAAMDRAAAYSAALRGQSMVVMFDGARIFEHYDNNGGAERLQRLASGTKSFVGIAAAAAVEDGIISLDAPVSGSITEWKNDEGKKDITYRQLLTLTSGLRASERGFAKIQPAWSDLADGPMTGQPGAQFNYGANQLNVFAFALERLLKTETFEDYFDRRVLDPLGISIEWRIRCSDGHPQVGGGAFIKSTDWAIFGEFVRLSGKCGEKQIIKSELVADCFNGTTPNPAYGQAWWLKHPVSSEILEEISILKSEWGDAANCEWIPEDLVAALGAGKQRLYVIPSRKLVIVRQATLPNRDFSDVEFLSLLLRNQPAEE